MPRSQRLRRVLDQPALRANCEEFTETCGRLDAASLFAQLSDDGRRPGSLLLESADRSSGAGQHSLLFPEPLLRLRLQGSSVELNALSDRVAPALESIATLLPHCRIERAESRRILLEYQAPSSSNSDERLRLRDPGVLDLVRALTQLVEDDEPGELETVCAGAFGHDLIDHFDCLPDAPRDVDDGELDLVLASDLLEVDQARARVRVALRALRGFGIDEARETELLRERRQRYATALPLAVLMPSDGEAPAQRCAAFDCDLDEQNFRDGVTEILSAIRAGEVFQAVLSRRLQRTSSAPPLDVYRELRRPQSFALHVPLPPGEWNTPGSLPGGLPRGRPGSCPPQPHRRNRT